MKKGLLRFLASILVLCTVCSASTIRVLAVVNSSDEAAWGTDVNNLTDSGTFIEAIAAVNNGTASYILLQQNIVMSNAAGYGTKGYGVQIYKKSVTIDGGTQHYSISTSEYFRGIQIVGADAEADATTVTFRNLTMFNDYYHVTDSPRCLDIRDGYVTVNVENSDFTAGKLENSKGQPITIGGYHDNSTIVNITGSTLTALADGYGIIAFCPTDLTIDNSTISGYAALFMKGPYDSHGTAGSHVTIQNNSTLKSYNDSNAETNEFSTIALEDGGISITVSNSTISAEATSTMTQSIISSNDPDPDSDYSYPGWTEATINFLSGTTLNLIGASANLYRSGGDGTHRETIQVNGVTNNDLVDILSSGDIIDIMTISSDGVINYNYTHPAEPTVIPESTPVPTFVVTFLDCDGNTVSVQSVPYQGNATAPTGYGTYVGYTDISANIDLKPTSCSAASKVKGYIVPNTADK